MDPLTIGYLGFLAFIILIFLRVPIAYGMGIVGTAGLFYLFDPQVVFTFIPLEVYSHTSNFTFSALPLFLLMGYLAYYADLSKEFYDAATGLVWQGAWRAGGGHGLRLRHFRGLLRIEPGGVRRLLEDGRPGDDRERLQ